MLVLFYAPTLGTFNTLVHSFTRKIPVVSNGWIYNLDENNHTITIEEPWFKFWVQDENEFFPLPKLMRIVPIIMMLCHIAIGYALIAIIIGEKRGENRRAMIINQMLQSLWTIACPPLFLDWEELYRHSKSKRSIRQCWNKSWTLTITFIICFTVEHLFLCAPLFVFRVHFNRNIVY